MSNRLKFLVPVNQVSDRYAYWIVPAQREHLYVLAENLRQGDRDELEAFEVSAKKALWRSWRRAIWARTAFVDGEIAAIWGINPHGALGKTAVPWLLTGPAIERAKFSFIREAKKEVDRMLDQYPHLENFLPSSYGSAIRFLRIMGFTIEEPEPRGMRGILFRRFYRER